MADKKYVGSIEAGGTKFIVAVQDTESGEVIARDRISTEDPKKTLEESAAFLRKIQ